MPPVPSSAEQRPSAPAALPRRSYYAHTASDAQGNALPESSGKWQPLAEHLRNVAELAAKFAAPFGASEEAYLAGLLHDLGKYRDEFQDYLRGLTSGSAATQHAIFGAVEAVRRELLPAALAIQGHHAGLHDWHDLQAALGGHPLHPGASLPLLLGRFAAELGPATASRPAPDWVRDDLEAEFFSRMLFSCLVDADRLDTAHRDGEARAAPGLEAERLLAAVIAERARKRRASGNTALQQIRDQIFDACLARAGHAPGFFSLTAPTGAGKTLASMAFALAHAHRHGLRRVVVVIPYLSIIEQNAAEYRRVLGDAVVLEHHSAVAPRTVEGEPEPAAAELAAENWDAPVIVTTAVQFLESLFAASPARCRKLHRLAGAVVIFDEAQTLPTNLLAPIFSVLRELQRHYGASFVFGSATLPAFRRSPSLPEDFFGPAELREIAPDPAAAFAALRRVDYHLPAAGESMDWPRLAARLAKEPQVLCVVNLTRHASRLWQELKALQPDPPPIHLSAAMCPQHRLDLIRQIGVRLRAGQPCRVISTQLVEAGVDLDFPAVWRALGPLDSIVQAAGRCNREGARPRGHVHVFRPADHKLPPGVYRTAADQTAVALAALGRDAGERLATDPSLFSQYFQALYSALNTDLAGHGETAIQEDRRWLRFREVARKAKVIPDEGRPVVVPFGPGAALIAELRARPAGVHRFTRADLRRLQRYMVNVRRDQCQQLLVCGQVQPLLPNLDLFALGDGAYHPELGVLVEQRPLEDFLQ
jgi:CRISPR-associated endonuclease/helicase Cas3